MGKVVMGLWMLTNMIILLFVGGVYRVYAEEGGLLSHWAFDEGTGSVVHDSSGNKMDGNVTGAAWVEGKTGKALSFKGTPEDGQFVEILFGKILKLADTSFTVTMWMKTSDGHYGQVLIEQRSDNTHFWQLRVQDLGTLAAIIVAPPVTPDAPYEEARVYLGGGHSPNSGAKINLTDGNWHHVAFGYDKTQKVMFGYADGQEHKPIPLDNFPVIEWSIVIGKGYMSPGFFNGLIDDVRIYNRVLSPEDVTHLFHGE